MTRVTKVLLVAGVVCLVLGLLVSVDVIDSKAHPTLTVALPVGAICLGVFFISFIFEKDAARFDEEQRARLNQGKAAQRSEAAPEGVGLGGLRPQKR
jgi:uncharacterized membrane protein HdeD (DUF308 family)